jgi:5-methylcytosine-specific restriction endonuclease McrA
MHDSASSESIEELGCYLFGPQPRPDLPSGSFQPPSLVYIEYIRSREWYIKAGEAKARAKFRCQICNSQSRLETHHRTYENLGCEQPEDLIVLCRKCHEKFHDKMETLHG